MMARRSDHTREELHKMALKAAHQLAERDGLRGLKARQIARNIGYTIGTFYNLFDDLDDLIVQINCETLDALYEACAGVPLGDEPEDNLQALAACYIQFTRDHTKLWNVLFEHQLPDGRELPEIYLKKIMELMTLVERALSPLFDKGEEAERMQAARALWSSLYGICALEGANKLPETIQVEVLVDFLISNVVAGIRQSSGDKQIPVAK